MIKKELRALRTLKATPKILELAVADTKAARTYQSSWGIYRYTGYQYNIFLRCQTLKGYLKVAMFLPKLLREGKDLPVYELFISKKAGQYLTWDCRKEQWREAMADNLPWIEDLGWNWRQGTVWINPEGKQTIQKYLGTQKSGWEGILEWQRKTKRENLEAMYKRETDRWDADLKLTPALPRGWTAWLGKEAVEEHYIFYEYKRSGAKEGYCTHCEKTVPIQEAGHNKKTVCSCCGAAVTMKSMGKQKYLHTKQYYAYLIQRTKTGLVVREFLTKNAYRKDEEWKKNTYSSEIRRAFFDREVKMTKAYLWDLYRNREHRFVATGNCCQSWGGCQPGKVYPGTIPGLAKQELKKTGFPEYWKENPRLDAEWYLAIYNYHPVIEQLVKAGLPRLVKDCLEYRSRFDQVEKCGAGELTKKMGLNPRELKRLREQNGGIRMLNWLQRENKKGAVYSDEMLAFYEDAGIYPDSLGFIRDRLSEEKLYNYIKKQCMLSGQRPGQLLETWKDYLNMAKKAGMDTEDPYVFKPARLKQRHDELVVKSMMKDLEKAAQKTARDYPKVEPTLREIREIYSYQGEEYTVIVPESILDIMVEGKALSHCVGTSTRYLDRIERRESYIMFLRKTKALQMSYYTLEVEPGGTVRQKRTTGDEQQPDIEDAKIFLKQWQKEIKKRLTEEEIRLAGKSKTLRLAGFDQMRKDKLRIHTGSLQGRMLVDVLMADLMENEEDKTA